MCAVSITKIMVYPVKSLAGVSLQESAVLRTGLRLDRRWAVVNANREVITGREYPRLLGISVDIEAGTLLLKASEISVYKLSSEPAPRQEIDVRLFKRNVKGLPLGKNVSDWLSGYLGIACELIMLGEEGVEMLSKYGGLEGDRVSYADTSPIHLISEESLHELNTRLDRPVLMNRFRPNIIIKGGKPYQEDDWKYIRIGDCEFEVNEHCKRCVFTTVDPVLQKKDEQQEPLRTLSTYRKNAAGAVTFGVNLIPRKLGKLHVGQPVNVIE
uniref:MOSC domain-containing protein n=1 Tax=Roseihalotalea indica TaxID=2867963 RepID=A0AA49GQY5_9BACT|nr:MOSC domain-containing protein [Tunicatimonas sp. TK19036]